MAPRIELVPISTSATIQRSWPDPVAASGMVLRAAAGSSSSRPPRCRPVTKPGEEQDAGQRQHPQRERVDARERHVRGADLERHDVVPEARQHRDHEQEDHERGVHREQLVVAEVGHELEAGQRQLGADAQGQDAADEEEDERVDDVHDPDLLVIGRRHPVVQAAPVRRGGRRQRGRCHRVPYFTVRVPVMFGWTKQSKGYVPAGERADRVVLGGDPGEDLALEDDLAADRVLEDLDVVRHGRVLVVELDGDRRVGRGLDAPGSSKAMFWRDRCRTVTGGAGADRRRCRPLAGRGRGGRRLWRGASARPATRRSRSRTGRARRTA